MDEVEDIFDELEDPRTGNAKRHPLHEIVLIALCTVLCGGETCADMALFGRSKRDFLREFLTLEHGIPSHDTFSRCVPSARSHPVSHLVYGVRIETRTASVSTDIGWLQDSHDWPGLRAIGKITATREINGKTTTETRCYLLSQACAPERFNTVVRSHWGIENQLHWVLDVIMDEDQARNRKDHGPQNLALLRKLALNLAKLEPSKGSMRGKLKRAGWDNAFLAQILTLFANLQMR